MACNALARGASRGRTTPRRNGCWHVSNDCHVHIEQHTSRGGGSLVTTSHSPTPLNRHTHHHGAAPGARAGVDTPRAGHELPGTQGHTLEVSMTPPPCHLRPQQHRRARSKAEGIRSPLNADASRKSSANGYLTSVLRRPRSCATTLQLKTARRRATRAYRRHVAAKAAHRS